MLLLPCFLNMADMSKFPFLATGRPSCHFGGIAAQVNVMQCCRLLDEYYPENVIKNVCTTLAIWGTESFIFHDLGGLSPP